jgi:hypothetical protein
VSVCVGGVVLGVFGCGLVCVGECVFGSVAVCVCVGLYLCVFE